VRLGLLIISLTLSLYGCVTVPNVRSYTTLALLADGMTWNETQNPKAVGDITLEQTRDFLEPQAERDCVPVWVDVAKGDFIAICTADAPTPERPSVHMPKRGGAVCRSDEDETKLKNALEQLCRYAGKACTKEIKEAIK
jgi:hypothetical protein